MVIKAIVGQFPEIYASKSIHDKYINISISCLGINLDQRIMEQSIRAIQLEHKTFVELDLLVARNIIEKNMGFINVNSDPVEGTTFNVYLPAI